MEQEKKKRKKKKLHEVDEDKRKKVEEEEEEEEEDKDDDNKRGSTTTAAAVRERYVEGLSSYVTLTGREWGERWRLVMIGENHEKRCGCACLSRRGATATKSVNITTKKTTWVEEEVEEEEEKVDTLSASKWFYHTLRKDDVVVVEMDKELVDHGFRPVNGVLPSMTRAARRFPVSHIEHVDIRCGALIRLCGEMGYTPDTRDVEKKIWRRNSLQLNELYHLVDPPRARARVRTSSSSSSSTSTSPSPSHTSSHRPPTQPDWLIRFPWKEAKDRFLHKDFLQSIGIRDVELKWLPSSSVSSSSSSSFSSSSCYSHTPSSLSTPSLLSSSSSSTRPYPFPPLQPLRDAMTLALALNALMDATVVSRVRALLATHPESSRDTRDPPRIFILVGEDHAKRLLLLFRSPPFCAEEIRPRRTTPIQCLKLPI